MAESEEEDLTDSMLFKAFKKLKVKSDWSSKEHSELSSSSDVRQSSSDDDTTQRKSPSKTFAKRVQPYPKDKLLVGSSELSALDKLDLTKEACNIASCNCNMKKRSLEDSSKGRSEKTPSSSNHLHIPEKLEGGGVTCVTAPQSASKGLLKEARLKLHHKQKDQKVILRAARLRLAGDSRIGSAAKKLLNGVCTFNTSQSPKLGRCSEKSSTFGASSPDVAKPDFKSVAAGSVTSAQDRSKTTPSESATSQVYEFLGPFRPTSDHSSAASNTERLTRTPSQGGHTDEPTASGFSSREVTRGLDPCPLHPGKCPKPCSCSQQARLDDWSEEELACYFEEFVHIPKKMSLMAEMMYT